MNDMPRRAHDGVRRREGVDSRRALSLEVVARKMQIAFPLVDQAINVTALCGRELVSRNNSPRLLGVVVVDRGLESLSEGVGLAQLPTQPTEQTHLGASP
jgi:hypothetical protein